MTNWKYINKEMIFQIELNTQFKFKDSNTKTAAVSFFKRKHLEKRASLEKWLKKVIEIDDFKLLFGLATDQDAISSILDIASELPNKDLLKIQMAINKIQRIKNKEALVNELFLYSILSGKIKLAKVFWKKGEVS